MSHQSFSSSEIDIEFANRQSSARVYLPLKSGFIRTLRINSATQTSPETIECVLEEAELSKLPVYKALSYNWGSRSDPGQIELNGEEYLVTRNLFTALKHLKAMGYDGALWIDAICINQTDVPERDFQVQLMSQIYHNAALVLLWLGPEADGSNRVFETILEGAETKFSSEWIIELNRLSIQAGRNNVFDSLMELLMREYWNRLWIVQEIAYAQDVIICCGLAQMPYSTLLNFLQALKHQVMDERMIDTQIGRIVRLYIGAIGPVGLKDPGSARSTNKFEDPAFMLARNAVSKKCFDPRDRIYGCHGMFSPALRQAIPIDYSKGPGDIILSATKSIIESTRRLDLILLKRRNESSSQLDSWEKNLPSWVPILDDKFGECEIFHEALNPRLKGSACGNKEAECRFSNNGLILEASGVLLGTISYMCERNYRPGDHMYGEEHEKIDLIKYIFGFLQSLGDRVQSRPELITFWTTILGSLVESHLVYESPQDQQPGAGVYRESTNISASIVNFAVQMQDVNKIIEERNLFTGWLRSALKVSLFSKQQKAFFEPIYRHFDYRGLFCFQRAPSIPTQSTSTIDGEVSRSIDIGFGPVAAKDGDQICVLYGCKVPVILRPHGSRFQVIGDTHLSDFMNGEVVTGSEQMQAFCLE